MKTALAFALVIVCALAAPAGATIDAIETDVHAAPLDLTAQWLPLKHAALSLPIAAALGAALAFRPRRRGTPPRTAAVIQTQIILALVGAVIMQVVGSSLARAFGIVGAASLIRYRTKIDDPKDAGVMLSCLAIGLASGVGLYLVAGFSTLFILGVLWLVESIEPEWQRTFNLKITTKDPPGLRPAIEALLRRNQIRFELRSTSNDDLCFEVRVPYDRRTDRLSNAVLALDPSNTTAVEWEEKKPKSAAAE